MGGRDDRQDAAAGLARQQQLLPHHDPPCDFDINGGGDHGRRAGHASAHQGPAKNAPLDERFEAILNLVEAAGFDNFDQMATTYYAQTLHAAEQLLAGVYGSSVQWSDWERKGFHEEVLRTMENMLAVEGGDAARAHLARHVGALNEALDTNSTNNNSNNEAKEPLLLDMKRAVQEAAPSEQLLRLVSVCL